LPGVEGVYQPSSFSLPRTINLNENLAVACIYKIVYTLFEQEYPEALANIEKCLAEPLQFD
jgi:hypothetical protein